jgi:pimeloyl-ACP methyl ester carboxylesterase
MTVSARSGVPTRRGDPVRTSFSVSVPLGREGTPGAMQLDATIAAWVFAPDNLPQGRDVSIWYLAIPGATYRGLAYYDRQVEGYAPEEFSLARFLARNGIGLVVIDTLGTGASELAVNGELITRFVVAEVNSQVLEEMRERLLAGMLVPGLAPVAEEALFLGGVGHSMGAYQLTQLAALLEDRGTPLDATVFVGWLHGAVDYARVGLDADALFAEMVAENGYYRIPRAVMRPVFYGPDPTVPAALIEADERDALLFPKGLLDEAMVPGIVAREAGTISSPVLYVVASHDFCPNAQGDAPVYGLTRLFTAYTQPQAAHCNFESSRTEYWQVVAGWSRMVAIPGHPFSLQPSGNIV